jgi:hypothetical protein
MPHLKALLMALVFSAPLLSPGPTSACPESEKKKCAGGDRSSCEAVASCYQDQTLNGEARRYYELACALGSWVSCEMVGDQLMQGVEERSVATCEEYLAAKKEGFEPSDGSTAGQADESFFKHPCATLEHLGRAKPSKQSFLADYHFSASSLADFPDCVDAGSKTKVTAVRPHGFTFADDAQEVVLELVAWGDWNGDGIEDVLANVGTYAVGGTLRTYTNVTFTRKAGEKVFRVVKEGGQSGDCR